MATGNEKKIPLKKHVGAVHSTSEISFVQRKIANALLYNAYPNLAMQEIHEIKISHLSELIGYNSRDLKLIKAALVKLNTTAIAGNFFDKEEGVDFWQVTTFIAWAKIIGPMCQYSYSPGMREILHNPERYAVIDLKLQARFNSSYGLALYENCIRFENIPSAPQTPWINIADFRRLMGIADHKYKSFSDLKKRVIDTGIQEVNQFTPIDVRVEYHEVSGKTTRIKFHIERKKMPLQEERDLLGESKPEQLEQVHVAESQIVKDLKEAFSITGKRAEGLIEQYGEALVAATHKMIIGSSSYKDDKIKSLPAYLTRALEEGYAKEVIANNEPADQEIVITSPFTDRQQYDRYVEQAVLDAYQSCNEEERRVIDKQFKESLKGFYINSFEKNGFADTLVRVQLVKFLKDIKHPILQTIESFNDFRFKKLAVS